MNAYRISPYKPDKKSEYQQYLWQLSWSFTPESVPQHAMKRCRAQVAAGGYSHMHPSTLYDDGSALGISYYGNYSMRKARPPAGFRTMYYSPPSTAASMRSHASSLTLTPPSITPASAFPRSRMPFGGPYSRGA
eukprot:853115-Prymnesium_polylepis.1